LAVADLTEELVSEAALGLLYVKHELEGLALIGPQTD